MTILQFLADALAVAPVLVTFAISGAVVGAIVAGPMGAGIGILTGLCAGAWLEFATAGRPYRYWAAGAAAALAGVSVWFALK
jgi:hypothetical protein